MPLGRAIVFELRIGAVAWIRTALAIHLAVLAPLAPVALYDFSLFALFLPWMVVFATPLVVFHRLIVRKEPPFLRIGYLVVAAYGPAVALALEATAPEPEPVMGVILIFLYEVMALVVTGLYVWLWRLGDRWFGEAEHPRMARRWALAAALVLTTVVYVPYAVRVGAEDSCLDAGGRVRADGSCDFGG